MFSRTRTSTKKSSTCKTTAAAKSPRDVAPEPAKKSSTKLTSLVTDVKPTTIRGKRSGRSLKLNASPPTRFEIADSSNFSCIGTFSSIDSARKARSKVGLKVDKAKKRPVSLKSTSELSQVSTLASTPAEHTDDDVPAQGVEVPRRQQQHQAQADQNRPKQMSPHTPTDLGGVPDTDDEEENPDINEEDNGFLPATHDDDYGDDVNIPEAEPISPKARDTKDLDDDDEDNRKPAARPMVDDMADDDDSKEGPGFTMAGDDDVDAETLTPAASAKKPAKKGRKKKNVGFTDKDMVTPTPSGKKGQKRERTLFSPEGVPVANRNYDFIPIDQFKPPPPEDPSLRRSKRARMKPLEYWKNEYVERVPIPLDDPDYPIVGDLSVVIGVRKALPTPRVKRKAPRRVTPSRPNAATAEQTVVQETLDVNKLERKYKTSFIKGRSAPLFDIEVGKTADQIVASRYHELEWTETTSKDIKGQKSSYKVNQTFYSERFEDENFVFPEYIVGHLELPPQGTKVVESVGTNPGIFTICTGQQKHIEVAYWDPDDDKQNEKRGRHFLLGPKDMFRIPPGNAYSIRNHSKEVPCLLTWTIINPVPKADYESDVESTAQAVPHAGY